MRDSTSTTRPLRKVGRTFWFDRCGDRPRRHPRATFGERRRGGGRAGSEPTGSSSAGNRPAPSPRRRILVVDDEFAMRALCRVNLVAAGMEVLEADDGTSALQLVTAEKPDLVVLDVMMPGLNGWEVAEALAEDPATRDIPIVFLSARAEPSDRARGRELGAVGYVTKPFDPVGIADLLERILERLEQGEREQLRMEITERS
jgi:putative two-component system response regulator